MPLTSSCYGHCAMMLETVAAVPGMVRGMLLPPRSLRMFEHSGGWIRALLEEAEGERMHLMMMVELVRPKWCERLLILTVLGFFFDGYFVLCLLSPEIAHRIFGFLKMGKLFVVEFDNINTGKFYICQFCSMAFAKNTDIYQYWKRSGDVLEEFVCFSYSQRVSNVVDSGIIYEAYNVHHQNYDWQEVHCVSCNNPVGFKFKDRDNRSPPEFYSLNSDKIVFRIDGEDHDPEIVSPEDWFDPPRPPCGICFPSLDYSQNQQ